MGSPVWRTVLRHVLPNVMPPIIIVFSITIGTVIITEASLSFLGCGLPLSVPSWGGLLSREGRRYMQVAPWLAIWPGIFLTVVGYGFNMFGDAVRDLLDPRLRGGAGRFSAPRRQRTVARPATRRFAPARMNSCGPAGAIHVTGAVNRGSAFSLHAPTRPPDAMLVC